MSRKAVAVANVAAVLAPTGVLFGASVLGRSGSHTWLARRYLSFFNWQGGFDNLDDTEDGLREILEASFEHVDLEIDRLDRGLRGYDSADETLPQIPTVDDAHPDALVDRRRSGHVLGIDVEKAGALALRTAARSVSGDACVTRSVSRSASARVTSSSAVA